jgi:hypothetical protein
LVWWEGRLRRQSQRPGLPTICGAGRSAECALTFERAARRASYLVVAAPLRAPIVPAAVLLPCDLREMSMLGDAGSNVLGALLGLSSVGWLTGRGRWIAIGALASLNILGEARSLGELIERTPLLRELDALGRQP